MGIPETNPKIPMLSPSLYETDFYAWTQEQVTLLRNEQWSQIDLQNLIEEIQSLGKQQRQELRNRLSVLIGHLLKWQYQPQRRSRSWLATLRIQRLDIAELLEDNPSLKPYLEEAFCKAYLKGVELAVGETDLPKRTFPVECPYSLVEIVDYNFYPGEPSKLLDESEQ
ncbi:hypothetical protein NIES4072_11200 [Nostoc commune NIES-4072]|uniref:DUF29 domain-containing protein n=1 Tax=Nostoc commune NIES-4072 TaxID=2005467 RepID=A0A2R5FPA9_NOSCO|nr:DUF29 domain-containing protein [Nostoc commune]BBD65211.1 hypothetical protein NIES4070_15620 [Nostoc commune HK-02]GBG17464.1 hypothetical protein NIES4072_11200 [Nostoc commune NIES-4072]